jgi:hypothetical protein
MFSSAIDSRSSVNPGSTPLNPTSSNDFRVHHGNKTWIQKRLANLGKRLDGDTPVEVVQPRFTQHSCFPWRGCGCFSNAGTVYQQVQGQSSTQIAPSRSSSVSTVSSGSTSSRLSLPTPASSTSSLVSQSQRRQSLPFIPPQHYGPSAKSANTAMLSIQELPAEPVTRPPAVNLPIRPPPVQPSPPPATTTYIQPTPQLYSAPRSFLNVQDEHGNAVPVTNIPSATQRGYNPVAGQTYTPNYTSTSYTPTYATIPSPIPVPPSTRHQTLYHYSQPQTQPQPLGPLLQEIKNVLLLHFLEGGGIDLPRPQLIAHALAALQKEFQAPIILARPCVDLELGECAEFEEIKESLDRCLEPMGIRGCVSLIPELGERGRLLGVHVFAN